MLPIGITQPDKWLRVRYNPINRHWPLRTAIPHRSAHPVEVAFISCPSAPAPVQDQIPGIPLIFIQGCLLLSK